MNLIAAPLAYAQAKRPRFVAELEDFIRFPSVSAQPQHADDGKKCAAWLANHLRAVGLKHVKIIPTPRHPIVYAEWWHAPAQPTVLIYGHYDVQPPDPLHEWHSPPFEPTVRGNDLYGRGASDDKGQLFTHVKALESYLHTTGVLPVNVKCLFEGEEEIGSPNLPSYLARNRDALASNVAVLSDMRILTPDRPAITYGLRGALSLEMEVHGPEQDLHSGNFGGAVHNPLQALCEIITSLHDTSGRVAIPGFYDRVRQWSEEERTYMEHTGPTKSAAHWRWVLDSKRLAVPSREWRSVSRLPMKRATCNERHADWECPIARCRCGGPLVESLSNHKTRVPPTLCPQLIPHHPLSNPFSPHKCRGRPMWSSASSIEGRLPLTCIAPLGH